MEMFAGGEKPKILIIDDQLLEAQEISEILTEAGCECDIVGDVDAFAEEAAEDGYRLVMADITDVGDKGTETHKKFVGATEGIPVIIMTKKLSADITVSAIELGVVDYIIKPIVKGLLIKSVENALKVAGKDHAANEVLGELADTGTYEDIFLETSLTSASHFVDAIESKTTFFGDWSQSVADLCVTIGRKMELPENEIWPLRSAAILHDIGNYNMEGSLLEKSKLTDDEQEQLKKHAENSAEVAINLNASPEVGKIIRHHHERYDGEGYPDGLTEETIPLGSRILAVADAYVAMRSERAFRSALPEVRALNELRSHSGKQFDPSVIEALINYLEQEGDA